MGRRSKQQNEDAKTQLYATTGADYKKSNTLINAKGKCTLLGQKLFSISIINARKEDGRIISKTYSPQLKKLFGTSSGSLYTHIKEQIHPKKTGDPSLLDWRVIYDDPKQKKIQASNVITNASFDNGVLEVQYNPSMEEFIIGMNKNFTMLNINEQFSLSSQYSFRLYEILKQYMDKKRAISGETGKIEMTVNLTELKLKLGIIDAKDHPKITEILSQETPDYETIEDLAGAKGTSYKKYGSFKQRVLQLAVDELNEKTSLDVMFDEIKSGRGGKVKEIRFIIDYKEVTDKEELMPENRPLTDADIDNILDEISDITQGKLRMSECRSVAKAADYDTEKVKKAYFLSQKSASRINNLAGWLISAIKDGYKEPSGVSIWDNYEHADYSQLDLEALWEN